MRNPTVKDIAAQLGASNFGYADSAVPAVSDPIADTPMVLILDQLIPYHGNPRTVRNPRYDAILASIRERGLDSPPPVTRRPGDAKYMIRNGGNTRLEILNELWTESRDEQFFRIPCLFRPWPSRGEVTILVGHLCENEMRGDLSFIERAVAVERARGLYESENGASLTQTELARRLSADGYPITQSHISRFQDAVRYLLPAIPTVLYAGLGRPQVERLTTLRRAAQRIWERRPDRRPPSLEFNDLFRELLSGFDSDPDQFRIQRVQDELIGRLAEDLREGYEVIALELSDPEQRTSTAVRESSTTVPVVNQPPPVVRSATASTKPSPAAQASAVASRSPALANPASVASYTSAPAPDPTRLQQIRQTIAAANNSLRDEPIRPEHANADRATQDEVYQPSQLDPASEGIATLRAELGRLALEIAAETGLSGAVVAADDGLGFVCHIPSSPPGTSSQRAPLRLLQWLSSPFLSDACGPRDGIRLLDELAPLLIGPNKRVRAVSELTPLSDHALRSLFRLILLARRLLPLVEAEGSIQSS